MTCVCYFCLCVCIVCVCVCVCMHLLRCVCVYVCVWQSRDNGSGLVPRVDWELGAGSGRGQSAAPRQEAGKKVIFREE
jgi:hypothetical protein